MSASNLLTRPRWSPYAVGAAIGVLSWATFFFMDKALGTSTSFVGAAAACLSCVAPEHVEASAYVRKEYFDAGKQAWKPIFDWQFALDLFLIVGAFLAAKLGGTFRLEAVPPLFARRFGPSPGKRYAVAFLGGAILLFGARMAGGCTSGHGISGGLQLALSSWTFFLAMFASGVVTARLLFSKTAGGA
jgi:uncharacterized membrane protein YedE/YeeE